MDRIREIEKIRKFNRYYANVLGKIDQVIYNQDFTLAEARVISEIHENQGCTATEVREHLGIDRGYMSRITQKLEGEDIIYKEQALDDKRQYRLYLTEHGVETFQRLVKEANRGVGKMIQSLSGQTLTELVHAMETIQTLFLENKQTGSIPSIRPFKPGDAGCVAYLHGHLYKETYGFGPMFEYYVLKGLADFVRNPDGSALWVAEVEGQIIGSIAITQFNETTAQLRWFILDEAYQGEGLGHRLMKVALEFCQAQDYHHVFLWTVNILQAARHLYKKFAFTLTEEKPNKEWTETELIEERWDLEFGQ